MINLRNNSKVEDAEFRYYAYMGRIEGEEKISIKPMFSSLRNWVDVDIEI